MNAHALVFTLLEAVTIKKGITDSDFAQVKPILDAEFERHLQNSWDYIMRSTDWRISFKALDGDLIVGVYALGNNQVATEVDLPEYRNRKGVEGVALAVLPEYKSTGVGRQLIEAPRQLGRDYIWGSALYALGNIQHWTKRRRIVGETPDSYITIEDYR